MLAPSRPPVPATALIGRSDEVDAVRALLGTPPEVRLVTVTGPPGVGKTRLALAAVDGRDDAAWADLAPVRSSRAVLPELARALGVTSLDEPGDVIDREVLLVVDNCEHLADAMPGLGRLLAAAPLLRILATSRERLHLSAEREFALAPLPMPDDADVQDWARLTRNPAIGILLDRAPGNIDRTPDTARALAEICVRLDGLPLAIELAAARLRVFTPAELAFRLDRRMPVLTGGARDAAPRHRDLRTAIAWSYELLSERDRSVFRTLSVFPGDWPLAAAAGVCTEPDVLDAVASLVDKSLVRRVGEAGGQARFTMLTSLHEYAGARLSEHGETDAARARHAAYVSNRARGWEQTMGTDTEIATWSAISHDRADLRVAFEVSRDTHDIDATLWLAAALGWYAYTHGNLTTAGRLRAIIRDGTRNPRSSPDARAAAMLVSGVLAYGIGDDTAARRDLDHLSGQPGLDDRRYAIAHAFLGHVAAARGEHDTAESYYLRAGEICDRLGNRRGTAWAAHDIGLLALESHDLGRAERLLRDALRRFVALDYGWAIAVTSSALAAVLVERGDVEESGPLLDHALSAHDDIGDRRGLAQCLEILAGLAMLRRSASSAARLLGAAGSQRSATAGRSTTAETVRLDGLHAGVVAALGAEQADHERQAGRTMSWAAVRALAARVAVDVPARPAHRVALTSRQREVAVLVAAGHTNRQIGRTLGISEKTTEIHVRNIMTRLAAPSRAGVAAWVGAHDLQPNIP